MILKFKKIGTNLFSSKYLIFTNTVIGSGSLVCGYIIAEQARKYVTEDMRKKFSIEKIKMLSILGAFYGTYETIGYHFIDKIKLKRVIYLKLFLDQLVLAPPAIGLFLMANESFDSNWDWKSSYEYTKKSFLPIYFLDMLFWIPAQYINFRFLPPRFRFSYVALASIIGNIFLSSLHLEFKNNYEQKALQVFSIF